MTLQLGPWTPRLDEAKDETQQRALLSEVSAWRAGRLTDIVAQRQASLALARLHETLNDRASAKRELEQYLSLSTIAPLAPKGEIRDVKRLLGGRKKPTSDKPKAREERSTDPAALIRSGKTRNALKHLRGKKSARAAQLRCWAQLKDVVMLEPEAQHEALVALEASWASKFSSSPVAEEAPSAQKAAEEPAPTAPSKVEEVMGQRVPRRRAPYLAALDAFAKENPDQLDALAAAALEDHVAFKGPKSNAPWLFTLVARALASGGAATSAAVEAFQKSGVFAVTAYGEAAFGVAKGLIGEMASSENVRLRRGLGRGSPREASGIWTLRLRDEDGERGLAIAGALPEGLSEEVISGTADRLKALNLGLLVAPSEESAALRAAAAGAGLTVTNSADPKMIAALVEGLPKVQREPVEAKAESAPASEPKAQRERSPFAEIADLLRSEAGVSPEAFEAPLKRLKRLFKAFAPASRTLEELESSLADERMASFLRGVDQFAPDGMDFAQGRTLAVRLATAHPDGHVASVLKESARYGGEGIEQVLETSAAVMNGGWTLHRVIRGATRKELRDNDTLSALSETTHGVWRIAVSKGGKDGEIVILSTDTPEGRAHLPVLMLEERDRVVLLPAEPDVLTWYGTLGGPEAVAWDEGASADLLAVLDGWSSTAT